MQHPIDVIVPVYRGLQDVIDCLDSVRSSHNNTPFELIIIDDCSPEPEVSQLLEQRARLGEFTLLKNEQNLGFVATVNRGMQLHPERDVLLLNSDTLVTHHWLDRICHSAYQADNIGTVTPFSNNATICSYPNFCQDNHLPSNTSLATLDTLCALANSGETVDVPTGVGFCMFIRRACLDAVGYFDVETFGKGYGEENDFCQRALKAGWKNVFALDTFVQHTGNVSFGDEHNDLKHSALGKLVKHHPNYERDVHLHIAEDPAKQARVKVWLASLIQGEQPVVIHVSHNRGGGTLRFMEELSLDIADSVYSLALLPSKKYPDQIMLTMMRSSQDSQALEDAEYSLYFPKQQLSETLIYVLKSIPLIGFHFHHMVDLPDWVMNLPDTLECPWLVTLHDYYYLDPSISLTDSEDKFVGDDFPAASTWVARFQHLLNSAQACIAPSQACAKLYQPSFPDANIITVYHEQGLTLAHGPIPVPSISKEQTLHVVVVGALSRIKGADLLEAVAVECQRQKLNIHFELIGFGYRDLEASSRYLTVSGRYQESDLSKLLEQRKLNGTADVVWFPAQWPETYSYTLSTAMASGLPIVAPDIGAFSERLYGREQSWIVRWDTTAKHFAMLFARLRSSDFAQSSFEDLIVTTETKPVQQTIQYSTDYLGLLGRQEAETVSEKPIVRAADMATQTRVTQWLELTLPLTKAIQEPSSITEHSRALGILYYLRSAPGLRRVARCIPLAWQRRIKQLLS